MEQRLQQFLDAENLNQTQLADALGVARASISHILSGRNKPGFDFIGNFAHHYPYVSLDWLITGKGKMYKNELQPVLKVPAEEKTIHRNELFDDNLFMGPAQSYSEQKTQENYNRADDSLSAEKTAKFPASHPEKAQKSISKVIVLYNDGSFLEL